MLGLRKFRKAKSAEEEKKMFDNAILRSTRSVTKWIIKIFHKWHATRENKNCLEEQVDFKFNMNKVHDLITDVADMTGEEII